jgi:hypothetical protein
MTRSVGSDMVMKPVQRAWLGLDLDPECGAAGLGEQAQVRDGTEKYCTALPLATSGPRDLTPSSSAASHAYVSTVRPLSDHRTIGPSDHRTRRKVATPRKRRTRLG